MSLPSDINPQLLALSSGYNLTRSLRFRASASANLSRTFGSLTARTNQTVSLWFKIGTLSTERVLYAGYDGTSADATSIILKSDNTLQFNFGGGALYNLTTSQVFRDPSAWYHLVIAYDTTQATAANRVKMYINGVQVTAFSAANYPVLNASSQFSYTNANNKISSQWNSTNFFDGYMAEFHFIDGQALTPAPFGSTNALTGVWQPAPYTGTYGTNGFYLKFTDNSTAAALGTDFSGNSNTWTTNNISVTAGVTYDSMTDVPTLTSATAANYAVLNPIVAPAFLQGAVINNGNLRAIGTNGVSNTFARSTMGISGKMYAEFFFDVVSSTASIGVAPVNDTASTGNLAAQSTNICYRSGGNKRVLGTETAYGASWAANDIIGVAVDTTANTVEFFKNGASQGVITSSAFFAQGACLFAISTDDVGSPIGNANFGQRPFTYTPPTGFVALNTFNLPASTIVKGNTVMDATLYTGTGATQSITNTSGFKPDFVWLKSRSAATNNQIFDSVRGTTKVVVSNSTEAETTSANTITSFNSGGFTVGTNTAINTSAATYVGWQWQAGQGTTSSDTNGNVTSTVSVNASAGFSVVTYTGTGAAATVGHGLGVAPKMIFVKNRDAADAWIVYHAGNTANPETDYLVLNTIAATADSVNIWNDTAPTSSVFSIGNGVEVNTNTEDYVAYCFADIDGYSKFGGYTGNGSTNGAFIYTGFRPRFVMVKQTNNVGNWLIWDTARSTYNQMQDYLVPNSSSQELNNVLVSIDALSNGFKCRTADNDINGSGDTYIYMAFAENPFKFSLAR